jgi:hypothetical protein
MLGASKEGKEKEEETRATYMSPRRKKKQRQPENGFDCGG